jgi:hypothetical protein
MSADFQLIKKRHVLPKEVDGIQVIHFAVGAGRKWLAQSRERGGVLREVVEVGMVLPGGTRLLYFGPRALSRWSNSV